MTSVASARKKIARLGGKLVRREVGGKDGRVHELNILFDTPDGGFARNGQLLRVRVESGRRRRNGKGGKRAVAHIQRSRVSRRKKPDSKFAKKGKW